MTPTRIESRLRDLIARYVALGGNAGAPALVHQPGRWSITTSGDRPALKATGATPDEAFRIAETVLTNMEAQRAIARQYEAHLAETLGV
jgi:hypothetical protein